MTVCDSECVCVHAHSSFNLYLLEKVDRTLCSFPETLHTLILGAAQYNHSVLLVMAEQQSFKVLLTGTLTVV